MSTKIERIQITNLKAITSQQLDLKGATAIITGRNDSGKSTLLKSIPDRIRFIRPDVVVREGATEGKGELTLTDGSRFVWEFDVKGKDKLTYITDKGIKAPVTVELGRQYFPKMFDVDMFLQSTPKNQSKQLQAIIGIDFTDIDARYDTAYKDRTAKNTDAERYHAKLATMLQVPEVKEVDLAGLQQRKEAERAKLNALYLQNKEANTKARNEWQVRYNEIRTNWAEGNESGRESVSKWNEQQYSKQRTVDTYVRYQDQIEAVLKQDAGLEGLVDLSGLVLFIASLPQMEAIRTFVPSPTPPMPPEPIYIKEMPDDSALQLIDAEILQASETNAKAKAYADYQTYLAEVAKAKKLADEANVAVRTIEIEREALIRTAKLPQGIAITPDGITVDGLPLSKDQISTSKLYIAALRIGSINLGEVKTLYFDASYLDNNNLREVEKWAESQQLQLLIERPALDGAEIAYELIQTL